MTVTKASNQNDPSEERRRQRPRESRLEAAVRELVALAGDEAARHVERATERLRAVAGDESATRHPVWFWSNQPRSRKLYRAARGRGEAKLLGVCAGIANCYGIEPLVLRLALVATIFFTQGLAIPAYLVLALLMDVEPATEASARRGDAAPLPARARRGKNAKAAPNHNPPGSASAQVDTRQVRRSFTHLEQRLRRLEGFVTSEHFDLHRELAKMAPVGNGEPAPAREGRRH